MLQSISMDHDVCSIERASRNGRPIMKTSKAITLPLNSAQNCLAGRSPRQSERMRSVAMALGLAGCHCQG